MSSSKKIMVEGIASGIVTIALGFALTAAATSIVTKMYSAEKNDNLLNSGDCTLRHAPN